MEAYKIVLIGESGVGKTSIISRYINNSFDLQVLTSSSAQFISKIIYLTDEISLKFDIWDTAGQEKFRSLAKIFYKDAKVIILVYDITNKASFDNLKNYWFNEIEENSISDVILAIVGNKDDLYENEQVSIDEGKKFAKEKNAIFKRTSALSNRNIESLFLDIAKKIIDPNYDYLAEDNKLKEEFIKRNNIKEKDNQKIDLKKDDKKFLFKKNCC
jgi:small GTP-binding protein